MDDVFFLKKPAGEVDLSYFHVSIDFAEGVMDSVDFFEVEQAVEGLFLLVDSRDVVVVVQCEFI